MNKADDYGFDPVVPGQWRLHPSGRVVNREGLWAAPATRGCNSGHAVDGVRVDVTDDVSITRYSIDGEPIPWNIVKTVGAVHATRPGEREYFWFEIVAYVPASWLSDLRTSRAMEAAARKRAAVNEGSR